MIKALRTTALGIMVCFVGVSPNVQAQENNDARIPEIKAMPPGYEKFRREWNQIQDNEELQRLFGEVALRQGRLELLERRQRELPEMIESENSALEILNKGLFGAQEMYWKKGSLWPWPQARFPLIVHDFIERWIPEYERATLQWMKATGKTELKYSLYQVWQWALPREEEILKGLEEELTELPERIKDAKQSLSAVEQELKALQSSLELRDAAEDDKKQPADRAGQKSAALQPADVIDAEGTGELFGKSIEYAQLLGCGNADPKFAMRFPPDSMPRGLGELIYDYMGFTMPCSGFSGGRRVDFQKACNEFSGAAPPMVARVLPWGVPVCWPTNRQWRPPKRGEAGWGINSVPLTGVCYEAYFGRPATVEEQKKIVPLLKYTERSLYVECFYMRRVTLQGVLANR